MGHGREGGEGEPAELGQDDLGTAALEHRLDDGLGHGGGLERGHQEGAVVLVSREEGRLGVALVDDDGADLGRVVARLELRGQTLVEGVGGRLGGGVVDHVRDRHPGGHRGDRDDHAVVAADHVREELLDHPVVRKGVDIKGEAHVLLARLEDGAALDDAGVVDEHGRVADLGADILGHGGDGLGRSDVALEVVDVRAGGVGEGLDVEHDDTDAALGQELDDLATDAAGAARDEDDLARPVVCVLDAVVEHLVIEIAVDGAEQAEDQQLLDARECYRMEDGKVLTLLGVLCEQEQRQEDLCVERGVADNLEHSITLEPFAGEESVVHRHLGGCGM